jgi:hypothetical protein
MSLFSIPTGIAAGQRVRGSDLAAIASATAYLLAPPVAQLYHTSAQAIPNNTWTALLFGTELVDSAGAHDTSTNTSRYTAVYAGTYLVHGRYTYAASATGFRGVRLAKNGTSLDYTLSYGGTPTASLTQSVQTQGLVVLAVGDYVEVQVMQTSGGNLNTDTSNSAYPSMALRWISD